MNNQQQVFDPKFAEQFVRRYSSEQLKPIQSDSATIQALFQQLQLPTKDQTLIQNSYEFINQQLREVEQHYASFFVQSYDRDSLSKLKRSPISPLAEEYCTLENLYRCVHQSAGIQLTEACWLQNVFHICASQSPTAMQCLALYLQLSEKDSQGSDLKSLFEALLITTGGKSDLSKAEPAFLEAATLQLALSCFPRVFIAEILGFTLAYCQSVTLIETCFPAHRLNSVYFNRRHGVLYKQAPSVRACIRDYLADFPRQQGVLWKRIQKGYWLYQRQLQRCRDGFESVIKQKDTPEQAMISLLKSKVKAAQGHHQQVVLQGKSLDSWLKDMTADPQGFLDVLKNSRYVNIGSPTDSELLKLFAFKGPMFGVMDKVELQTIQRWLKSLAGDSVSEILSVKTIEPKYTVKIRAYADKPLQQLSNRDLYYYLINADLFPDILPVAKARLRCWLKLCEWFSRKPFKYFNQQAFSNFIEAVYQQEMKAYQPLQGKPGFSKPAYVWGLEQVAPMILIDGCWLQNSLSLKNSYPEIADILFRIYCDETGNGVLAQNHPHIFQQLLDDLSINLPPVHSADFAQYPGFMNSSFDLPVYMLSLASFSVEYLPELLGLNMAIEISGLGKSYMTLVDEWNYWGINPTIAKIHISIDNIASGHSFLAQEAIRLYMRELFMKTADQAVVDQHWVRIYTGYASLRVMGTRFKMSLPIGYLMRRFGR